MIVWSNSISDSSDGDGSGADVAEVSDGRPDVEGSDVAVVVVAAEVSDGGPGDTGEASSPPQETAIRLTVMPSAI
jgi:hypothetical protein